MHRTARQMALTAELVARVHRIVEDTGPEPDRVYHTERSQGYGPGQRSCAKGAPLAEFHLRHLLPERIAAWPWGRNRKSGPADV